MCLVLIEFIPLSRIASLSLLLVCSVSGMKAVCKACYSFAQCKVPCKLRMLGASMCLSGVQR